MSSHGWVNMKVAMLLAFFFSLAATVPLNTSNTLLQPRDSAPGDQVCKVDDSPRQGWSCGTSKTWAHHAPFFSVENIKDECDGEQDYSEKDYRNQIPEGCTVDFVQMLSRHGARGPVEYKGKSYEAAAKKIQDEIKKNPKRNGKRLNLDSLRSYEYNIVPEELNEVGKAELRNSGKRFVERYPELSKIRQPFIRSTTKQRVIDSANQFIEGFQAARSSTSNQPKPKIGLMFDTKNTTSNPLFGGNCPAFYDTFRAKRKAGVTPFFEVMMPKIRTRLKNEFSEGLELEDLDILSLMELCSFDTLNTMVITKNPFHTSAFCDLFTEEDWKDHEYLQSLMYYYTYGMGNTLGRNQGIGYLNELIARLTKSKVKDETTVNHTIYKDPKNFPLNRVLYADFTHDIAMVSIFAAMGLFTKKLPLKERQDPSDPAVLTNSWVVPFAGRAYFERMKCKHSPGDSLIRLIINERVIPLPKCRPDKYGACEQKKFIKYTLKWARENGDWHLCKGQGKKST